MMEVGKLCLLAAAVGGLLVVGCETVKIVSVDQKRRGGISNNFPVRSLTRKRPKRHTTATGNGTRKRRSRKSVAQSVGGSKKKEAAANFASSGGDGLFGDLDLESESAADLEADELPPLPAPIEWKKWAVDKVGEILRTGDDSSDFVEDPVSNFSILNDVRRVYSDEDDDYECGDEDEEADDEDDGLGIIQGEGNANGGEFGRNVGGEEDGDEGDDQLAEEDDEYDGDYDEDDSYGEAGVMRGTEVTVGRNGGVKMAMLMHGTAIGGATSPVAATTVTGTAAAESSKLPLVRVEPDRMDGVDRRAVWECPLGRVDEGSYSVGSGGVGGKLLSSGGNDVNEEVLCQRRTAEGPVLPGTGVEQKASGGESEAENFAQVGEASWQQLAVQDKGQSSQEVVTAGAELPAHRFYRFKANVFCKGAIGALGLPEGTLRLAEALVATVGYAAEDGVRHGSECLCPICASLRLGDCRHHAAESGNECCPLQEGQINEQAADGGDIESSPRSSPSSPSAATHDFCEVCGGKDGCSGSEKIRGVPVVNLKKFNASNPEQAALVAQVRLRVTRDDGQAKTAVLDAIEFDIRLAELLDELDALPAAARPPALMSTLATCVLDATTGRTITHNLVRRGSRRAVSHRFVGALWRWQVAIADDHTELLVDRLGNNHLHLAVLAETPDFPQYVLEKLGIAQRASATLRMATATNVLGQRPEDIASFLPSSIRRSIIQEVKTIRKNAQIIMQAPTSSSSPSSSSPSQKPFLPPDDAVL